MHDIFTGTDPSTGREFLLTVHYDPSGTTVEARTIATRGGEHGEMWGPPAPLSPQSSPALPINVKCIARHCSDETVTLPNWAACEAWFDDHAREVEHDGRWPITYAIGYCGRPPSGADGVAYRDPVLCGPPAVVQAAVALLERRDQLEGRR
jgi:hypothetical protein